LTPNYQLIEKNIELAGPHMGGGSPTNVPLQPPFDGGMTGFWCIGGICHDGNTDFERRLNAVHCPLVFGDSHFFGVAPSGACWCIDEILCFRNNILRSEFGGYTAHHLTEK